MNVTLPLQLINELHRLSLASDSFQLYLHDAEL